MNSRPYASVVALILIFFATKAPAAVMGIFPGLTVLFAESDDVVVAQVISGPEAPRVTTENVWQAQIVRILYVLKGPRSPQSEVKVRLSPLTVLGGGDFVVGERYLLCLRTDSSTTYLVNARWSAFRVPASTRLTKLHGNDMRENIAILLADLVRETTGPDADILKREAAEYLQSP
jgi:hypothetical protein